MALATPRPPSNAAIQVSVNYSPNWEKLANRYKGINGRDELVRTGLIKWAMAEGVKTAVSELDKAVYSQPAARSGYVRTGRTRGAVVARPGPNTGQKMDSGAIVVDKSRFSVYYPLFLEGGTARMAGRHFWRNTRVLMSARFSAQARVALRAIKTSLQR